MLDREGPAEATALVGMIGLQGADVGEAVEQLPGRIRNPQLAARRAGVVQDDLQRWSQIDGSEIQGPHHKLGKFIDPTGQILGAGLIRGAGKKPRVVHAEHARAGGGGDYHRDVRRQGVELGGCHRPGLVPITGIVGRLTATGLALGVADPDARTLKQPHGGQARLWIEQIDQTGPEEVDRVGFAHGRIIMRRGTGCSYPIPNDSRAMGIKRLYGHALNRMGYPCIRKGPRFLPLTSTCATRW